MTASPAKIPVVIDGTTVTVAPPKPLGRPFQKGSDERRQMGRLKGSRNKVTLLRLELEESLREELNAEGMKVLKKAIQLAKQGNEKVIKVLLDKMLASPKGDDASEAKDNDVKIVIQNLTHGEQKTAVVAGPSPKAVIQHEERP